MASNAEWHFPEPGRCWWCGALADSREHRHKRTDLVRQFGQGPWRGEQRPQRLFGPDGLDGSNGLDGPLISGPRSSEFKFSATICSRCNNRRSQAFDAAYDRFIDVACSRRPGLLSTCRLDLRKTFGPAWQSEALNLYRYFCKHIGCCLAEPTNTVQAGIPVDLIEFLNGGDPPASVAFEIVVDRFWLGASRLLAASGDPGEIPAVGPLLVRVHPETGLGRGASSWMVHGWLRFKWETDSHNPRHPFSQAVFGLRREGPRRQLAALTLKEARTRVMGPGPRSRIPDASAD